MDISAKLRKRLKAMGLTQVELAKQLGMAVNTVNRWCAGDTIPARESMEALSRILKRDVAWFYTNDLEVMESVILLPVISDPVALCAGGGIYSDGGVAESGGQFVPVARATVGVVGEKEPFIMRVSGDSMAPVGVIDGCLVVINPEEESRSGDMVAVCLYGDTLALKWVYFGRDGIDLRSANAAYQPIHFSRDSIDAGECIIIGKVMSYISDAPRGI